MKPEPSLENIIKTSIEQNGDLSFADYMALALYHPKLGYYCRDQINIGKKGDFITAPELSPLFSQSIAKQINDVATQLKPDYAILELGAGLGTMAAHILNTLEKLDRLPEHYYILEISERLIAHQKHQIQTHCPHIYPRVQWIADLKDIKRPFEGVILGNEFLDALPVALFQIDTQNQIKQGFVTLEENKLAFTFKRSDDAQFNSSVQQCLDKLPQALPVGFVSEINLNLKPWLEDLNNLLEKGVILFLDYGFDNNQYYHPDRKEGTLMCHHQHHAHDQVFEAIGEQDLTAHINFSHLCEIAQSLGFDTLGYTNQASFLLSLGILDNLTQSDITPETIQRSQALQVLLQPHEMGELIKVIAFGKGFGHGLQGFAMRNVAHKL